MSTPEKDSQQRPARAWRAGIRRWWAPVIVGLVVVLGGAGVIALLNMPNKDAPPIGPSSTTAPTKPSAPSADGCDAPAGEMTAVPDDLKWEAVEGITWPVSASLGPTADKNGWATCFSRSPVGAALAATSSVFSAALHPAKDVSEFYIADSPGKDAAVTQSAEAPSLADQFETSGLKLVGFRVDEYTKDRAMIRLVVSSPNSQTGFVGLPYPMVWVDDDWRVKVLDDGSTGQPVPVNEGQFTRWSNG